ncbi:hypothetical protein ACO0K9_02150 [Undibacterium sp. Ji50W]|uniref:hypothetical protein n=1 Tax=Undibacterium sp. Ji50W TaxID=3413041 RepID=UPI003BF3A9C1
MKIFTFSILLAFFSGQLSAADNVANSKIEMQGVGIKSILPNGFKYPRLGTLLIDDTGTAGVTLIAAQITKNNVDRFHESQKYSFPNPPELFTNGKLKGQLYKRSRVGSIGNWDGIWLSVTKSNMQLDLIVFNQGPQEDSPEVFKRMRLFLDNLEWDESKLDSETAFGARVAIPGMVPVKKVVGALAYNKTGEIGDSKPSVQVNALPFSRALNVTEFTKLCTDSLSRVFAGKKYDGPFTTTKGGISVCDGSGPDGRGNTMYVAVANLQTGNVMNAIGYIPLSMTTLNTLQIRDAILNLKLLR